MIVFPQFTSRSIAIVLLEEGHPTMQIWDVPSREGHRMAVVCIRLAFDLGHQKDRLLSFVRTFDT